MQDHITIVGTVGTNPEFKVHDSGMPRATFRIASTERRRTENGWENGDTNWYSVTCFRSLATNVNASVTKGQRLIVQGRLQLNEYTPEGGIKRIRPEIVAGAIGHDLTVGPVSATKRATENQPTADDPTPETERSETPTVLHPMAAADYQAPTFEPTESEAEFDVDAETGEVVDTERELAWAAPGAVQTPF